MIDRTRTGDNQDHNLGLYQLSYDHRWKGGKVAVNGGQVKSVEMSKDQFPMTKEFPMTNSHERHVLEIVAWSFLGIWSLDLGHFPPVHKIPSTPFAASRMMPP